MRCWTHWRGTRGSVGLFSGRVRRLHVLWVKCPCQTLMASSSLASVQHSPLPPLSSTALYTSALSLSHSEVYVCVCVSQGALPAPRTWLPFTVMRFGSCSNRIKHVKCSLCLYAWRVIEMCYKCVCVYVCCVCVCALLCHDLCSRECPFHCLTNDADNIAVFYASSHSISFSFFSLSLSVSLQNLCLCSFPSIFVLRQQQTGDEIPNI